LLAELKPFLSGRKISFILLPSVKAEKSGHFNRLDYNRVAAIFAGRFSHICR